MILTKKNTLIILDWDDTLFPTTWFTSNNLDIKIINKNQVLQNYFKHLDGELQELFKHLINLGDVIIVTNAQLNWINISASILPLTSKFLRMNKKSLKPIEVISARAFAVDKSMNPNDWKHITFEHLIYTAYSNKKYNNVISVGDADYEYKALVNLYSKDSKNYKLLKSIKFIKYPPKEVLVDQIKVLKRVITKVCIIKKHLDLNFKQMNKS
jgi:hypothetical protein